MLKILMIIAYCLVLVGCSDRSEIGKQTSQLSTVTLGNLPEGILKKQSNLTYIEQKTGESKTVALDKVEDLSFVPGKYIFGVILNNQNGLFAKTIDGHAHCAPKEKDMKPGVANALTLVLCKSGDSELLEIGDEGDLDLDLDIYEEMESRPLVDLPNKLFNDVGMQLKRKEDNAVAAYLASLGQIRVRLGVITELSVNKAFASFALDKVYTNSAGDNVQIRVQCFFSNPSNSTLSTLTEAKEKFRYGKDFMEFDFKIDPTEIRIYSQKAVTDIYMTSKECSQLKHLQP